MKLLRIYLFTAILILIATNSIANLGLSPKTSIAQSMHQNENQSIDYSEITFNLRKGHLWSDGAPFTADDVLFYLNDIILNKELLQIGVPD